MDVSEPEDDRGEDGPPGFDDEIVVPGSVKVESMEVNVDGDDIAVRPEKVVPVD